MSAAQLTYIRVWPKLHLRLSNVWMPATSLLTVHGNKIPLALWVFVCLFVLTQLQWRFRWVIFCSQFSFPFISFPYPHLNLSFCSLSFQLKEIESWVLIGKMVDKVCFWAAMSLFIIGTVWIFLTGHFNRAPELPFPGESKKYVPT